MKLFRAKQITYLDKEKVRTFKVWHPQVKINNKWCYLVDETTKSKLAEAADEMEATEKAITALRGLKELLPK